MFGPSNNQLSLNKFFDPSTPSMRKGRDGGRKKTGKKRGKKGGETGGKKKKRMMKIVATMSLPAVDLPSANHWNAERSCQYELFASFCNVISRRMHLSFSNLITSFTSLFLTTHNLQEISAQFIDHNQIKEKERKKHK